MTETPKTYTIGDLAREFGCTLRTLRFYEARGLLTPERKGFARIYDEAQRARLAEIVHLTRLGFTLAEIKAGEFTAKVIRNQIKAMERRKREVEAAIAELERRLAA